MNVAQIIQKKNKKFDEWIKTMISEESEDHYLIAGTAIETGYTADLQVAFEAGQHEKVLEISRIVQRFRKADEEVLKEEPCCKVNVKGEKDYCQFHGLLHSLDIWIEKE
jgi:hypothetical protein